MQYGRFDADAAGTAVEDVVDAVGQLRGDVLGGGRTDLAERVGTRCGDWYAGYKFTDVKDPQGPATGERKVKRGGSWASTEAECRAAARSSQPPGQRSEKVGFRVVLVLPDPAWWFLHVRFEE